MESLDGMTDLFIEEIIIMVKDKEMDSFIMQKIQALAEDFGNEEFLMGKDNMYKVKIDVLNVFGAKENLLDLEIDIKKMYLK